tara:strand:- start:302 stop:583 length:282 start_codon:yes stop_codon:yes gene_type:complete
MINYQKNIYLVNMKYDNVTIDLKQRPVLQELIEDLTNKMLAQKQLLVDCGEDVSPQLIKMVKQDVKLLDEVIERCYMQQELIDMRNEQIIGLN